MADSKDGALDDIEQAMAVRTSDLEQNDTNPPASKVPPSPSPNAIMDLEPKVWIVAFGGFCCLYAFHVALSPRRG
jgi:hypothetical protein